MRKLLFVLMAGAVLACSAPTSKELPRAEASPELVAGFQTLLDSVVASFSDPTDYMRIMNLHSIMVVKDGAVVLEKRFGEYIPDEPHTMFSVSKTFTSMAVGMVINEGKLSLDAPVAPFFPDKVVPGNPCSATVKDLLMMAGGHETDPTLLVMQFDRNARTSSIPDSVDIARTFFAHPFVHAPGTHFCYNSLGTYLLSSIVTKVTGESVLDYLTPRLFEPLGIDKPQWDADAEGVSLGGWGLNLRTEDMAKAGLLLLQKGKWNGRQLLPAEWVEEMGKPHVECAPANIRIEDAEAVCGIPASENDWRQGYGYQTWCNTHEGFRADGAGGQFILVLPEKNAVVAVTAWLSDAQREMDLIWDYLYPVL